MRVLMGLMLVVPLCAQATMEQLFYCTDGESGYDLYLSRSGQLQATPKNESQPLLGTYTNTAERVSLVIPGVFEETSTQVERAKGLYLTLRFPSLFCHAVGHDQGPAYAAYAECPDIKYIPSVSYEKNHFQFYQNHMVKRRRWRELLSANDTLYSESYGIYLVEADQVSMFFGDAKSEQLLTGRIINDTGLAIDQLEPAKGNCTVQ